ncbi:MAG: VanW family protein [Clostridiales bacterium]|jgi:vancomycin resistance protein YoaR|nr:VanW family protein [Clostridiales bacterium]
MKKAIIIIAALMLTGCTTREAQTAAFPLEAQASDAVKEPAEKQAKASFTTWYRKSGKNRSKNIELAAEAINGYVIMPGATFSFNDAVGPTGKASGYKLATVYFNKKKTKGYGGGVCQVSTTLFNAAEIAGMEIVERHKHPEPVPYVEEGRDATTSGRGKLDLKIKNISPEPMTIKTTAEKGVLTVEIY